MHVKEHNKDLMDFIDNLYPDKKPLFVEYIDEGPQSQPFLLDPAMLIWTSRHNMRMWYDSLGAKSYLSFYNPSPVDSEFLFSLHGYFIYKGSAFSATA
jgi:hypothetical protein